MTFKHLQMQHYTGCDPQNTSFIQSQNSYNRWCLGSQIKIITKISRIKISLTIVSRDNLVVIRTGLFVLLHLRYFAHLGGRDDSPLLRLLMGQTSGISLAQIYYSFPCRFGWSLTMNKHSLWEKKFNSLFSCSGESFPR